jgi:hypothetical protein
MTIVEMQSCLARLYVSDGFRTLFLHDPAAALASYDLAPKEAAAIVAIDRRMLDAFAATLYNKRKKRFQRAYAASFIWHGAAMNTVLRRFLEIHGARSSAIGHQDTLDFGDFAEQTLADHERFNEAAAELVRFERLVHDAAFVQPKPPSDGVTAADDLPPPALEDIPMRWPGVLIDDFRYDVVSLDVALRAGETVADPEPVENTLVFRPGHAGGEQRMLRVNNATGMVLRLCDGQRRVADIVHAVENQLGTADLADPIRDTLQRLSGLHILSGSSRRRIGS